MLGIGLPEMVVLGLVALFVFGPDRLPEVARQAGKMLRQVRQLMASAQTQISDELGPEFANLDLSDPKALVKKHLMGDDDDDEKPLRYGHRPLEQGESAPFDVDAT